MILLTGATGFVGRQVLRTLQENGTSVRVVTRRALELGDGEHGAVEVVHSPDLFAESQSWWKQTCRGIETVIHVAWYTEPGEYLESSRNFDCLTGTLQLARGACEAGVRRFIGVGTCFEYDLSVGRLPIDTPLRPSTPYAAAKASVFTMLSQWLPLQQVEFAWCRLFYLYGEGEHPRRLVPYLRAKLKAGETAELTSGTQIRDFMDVKDAAEGILRAALTNRTGAINVCSGVGTTVRQLAERIADEYGRRDLLRFGARPDNLVDPPVVIGVP